LKCQEATARLSQSLDGPLSLADSLRVRGHLVGCRSCRTADAQWAFIRRALRQVRQHQEPTVPP
jgi:predicted anti-sigma-YlaC factor YlaD